MAASDAGYADISEHGALLSLFITVHNHGSKIIRLHSITPMGPGIGTVAAISRVSIAVDSPGAPSVTLGGYRSDPPSAKLASGCVTQRLAPVEGFRLKPDQTIRLAELIRGVNRGRYKQSGIRVAYDVGSDRVTQTLASTTLHGRIVRRVPATSPRPAEWECAPAAQRLPL